MLQGEALFNDGVGIVAFTALIAFATGVGDADPVHAHCERGWSRRWAGLVLRRRGGDAHLSAPWLTMDEFAVEVSMTIALTMAIYAVANALHLSGAIAVVGAGMDVRRRARQTWRWSARPNPIRAPSGLLVDEILCNAPAVPAARHRDAGSVLFVLAQVMADLLAVIAPSSFLARFALWSFPGAPIFAPALRRAAARPRSRVGAGCTAHCRWRLRRRCRPGRRAPSILCADLCSGGVLDHRPGPGHSRR